MTRINKTTSDLKFLKIGLPQGTILAPWLFIQFLNNLFKISTCGQTLCYADDTILLCELDHGALTTTNIFLIPYKI